MKKLMVILALFFFALSLFAQEPVIKFYMNDGNIKQNNISEIANISFIKSNLSYSMHVFPKGSNTPTSIDIRTIDSIIFENERMLMIMLTNKTETFNLSEIDSIIFKFNTCEEIQIGSQIWMCKNLDVDHYRNGDPIPEVKDKNEWANLKTGAWCYYYNDPAMGAIYGKLYNWYAVNDTRGLAPDGWHVASDAEWTTLTSYLGGENVAGGKLKETGISHWQTPNTGATNESGFSALPGGWRDRGSGSFYGVGGGSWWSATEDSSAYAWSRYLNSHDADLYRYDLNMDYGFSVRCVRD